MGKIYSSAANVIAWLGCDQGTSRAVRKLGDLLTGRLSLFGLYCDLMEDIESSPYWKRLWIVQEVMLATELFVMCGTECFEWNSLASDKGTGARWNTTENIPLLNHRSERLISEDPKPEAPKGLSLTKMLMFYAWNQCEDPRDKVYGLLGLVHNGHNIKIDYQLSTAQVFMFAVEMI
jgi:hypothetical protein